MKVAELEEKDTRRAVILADVLEKTARQYQQQLGQPPRSGGPSPNMKRRQADYQTALVDDIRFAWQQLRTLFEEGTQYTLSMHAI